MTIALKYWAFQQDGWGHVDETPPPTLQPTRSGDDGFWVPVFGRQQKFIRPPVHIVDRGFPQNLVLFDHNNHTISTYTKIPNILILSDRTRSHIDSYQTTNVTIPLFQGEKIAHLAFSRYSESIDLRDQFTITRAVELKEQISLLTNSTLEVSMRQEVFTGLTAFTYSQQKNKFTTTRREALRLVTKFGYTIEREENDDEFLDAILPALLELILSEMPLAGGEN